MRHGPHSFRITEAPNIYNPRTYKYITLHPSRSSGGDQYHHACVVRERGQLLFAEFFFDLASGLKAVRSFDLSSSSVCVFGHALTTYLSPAAFNSLRVVGFCPCDLHWQSSSCFHAKRGEKGWLTSLNPLLAYSSECHCQYYAQSHRRIASNRYSLACFSGSLA